MNFIIYLTILVVLVKSGFCKPNIAVSDDYDPEFEENEEHGMQNDDYDYNDTDGDVENDNSNSPPPIIVTKPMEIIANLNQAVSLPCETKNAVNNVLMWYKDGALLFQDNIALGNYDHLYKLDEQKTLVIKKFTQNEAGNYMCAVLNDFNSNPNITHKVYLPTSPKIEELKAQDDILEIEIGKKLILTCKADGHPKPNITWHRGADRIGTQGENLVIENVSIRDAGTYRCLADNKVGTPAHSYIDISIIHKPSIRIEKMMLSTDTKTDVEFTCIVYASPKASVIWRKEEKNIKPDKNHIFIKNNESVHTLLIKDVQPSDIGQYICSASNRLGTTDKPIQFVTTPTVLRYIKPKDNGRDVTLMWEVESSPQITTIQIQYRKRGHSDWINKHIEDIEPKNIIRNIYLVKFTIKNLEPGNYEIRMRSKNINGWSEFTEITPFEGAEKHGSHSTKHHKKGHKTHKEDIQNTVTEDHLDNTTGEDKQMNMEESMFPAKSQETSSSTRIIPTLYSVSLIVLLQIMKK